MSFARSCTHVLVNMANPYAGMRGAHAESPVIWIATKPCKLFLILLQETQKEVKTCYFCHASVLFLPSHTHV